MSPDAELTALWAQGWSVSRGTPPPAPTPWGLRIEVGASDQLRRHLPLDAEPAGVAELAASIDEPHTWIKTHMAPETLEPLLGPGWSKDTAGWLMDWEVAPAAVRVPEGYSVTTDFADGVTRIRVLAADGSVAARAQYGHRDGFGVIDRVRTAAAHQRRGLGSLVMGTLADVAHDHGARTSILGATVEGRALYEALGWTVRAPLAGFVYRDGSENTG